VPLITENCKLSRPTILVSMQTIQLFRRKQLGATEMLNNRLLFFTITFYWKQISNSGCLLYLTIRYNTKMNVSKDVHWHFWCRNVGCVWGTAVDRLAVCSSPSCYRSDRLPLRRPEAIWGCLATVVVPNPVTQTDSNHKLFISQLTVDRFGIWWFHLEPVPQRVFKLFLILVLT